MPLSPYIEGTNLLDKKFKLKSGWAFRLLDEGRNDLVNILGNCRLDNPIFRSEFSQLDGDGNITLKRADIAVPFYLFEEI